MGAERILTWAWRRGHFSLTQVMSRRVFMLSRKQKMMTAGVSSIGSFLFFYIFFIVLLIFLLYGLWEVHQTRLRELPNPLSAAILGVPESIALFDNAEAILRVENCGERLLRKVRVTCGSTWTFPLEPGAYRDIPIKLEAQYAGRHQLRAHMYCKHWELHVFCSYQVLRETFFQKELSQKEKYLKTLGLKLGAGKEEIRKARNRLAKMYHPDLESGHEEKMKEINEAYQHLMDS